MLVPLIMAIWFGVRAHMAGRNWFLWSLGGVILSLAVGFGVGILAKVMVGPLFVISALIPYEVIVIGAAPTIIVLIGHQVLKALNDVPPAEPVASSELCDSRA